MAGLIPRLARDGHFGAAILAALVFWVALLVLTRPAVDLTWPASAPLAFLLPALAYPVLEEIAFRGALQGALWKTRLAGIAWGPISAPNLLTSVVFMAAHFFWQAPYVALSVIVPSLIFGYFRDRYRHILPAVLLHVFYNTGFVLLFNG